MTAYRTCGAILSLLCITVLTSSSQSDTASHDTQVQHQRGVLALSTRLGGGLGSDAGDVAVDRQGNVYVALTNEGVTLPARGTPSTAIGGRGSHDTHIYLAKFSPEGTLLYSRGLGGSASEWVQALAVEDDGALIVTGVTSSQDFPGVQAPPNGSSAFVVKLASQGDRLIYSVVAPYGSVALDSHGRAWVASAAASGIILARLASDGTTEWSQTFSSGEFGRGVSLATGTDDTVYLAGSTTSADIRAESGFQRRPAGGSDGFVVRFSPEGELLWSTYLGGRGEDVIADLAVDTEGRPVVVGSTASRDFPTRQALQRRRNGEMDAFATRLSADGARLDFSTYLGGRRASRKVTDEPRTIGSAVALASDGTVWVGGHTYIHDFPLVQPLQRRPAQSWGAAAFLTRLQQDGRRLVTSTFFGGGGPRWLPADDITIAGLVTTADRVYFTGRMQSGDFPQLRSIHSDPLVHEHGNSYLAGVTLDPAEFGGSLGLSTRRLDFGVFRTGQSARRELHLTNSGQTPLRVSFSGFAAEAIVEGGKEAVIPPGQRHTVVFELGPYDFGGRIRASVALVTSDPRHAIEYVDLVGKVVRRR